MDWILRVLLLWLGATAFWFLVFWILGKANREWDPGPGEENIAPERCAGCNGRMARDHVARGVCGDGRFYCPVCQRTGKCGC